MIVRESDIEFDFTAALNAHKHDDINEVFPDIDFILEEPTVEIWLEVKNWEGSSVTPNRRGGQRRAFLARMRSKEYFKETLRGKFVGTVAYRCLMNQHPTKDIHYIVLLESPRMDSALMFHATNRMRGLIVRRNWKVGVTVSVMNLSEWNARFPQYPAVSV